MVEAITQTASHIHIRHVQSVWAHRYDVHCHMVAAWHSYTSQYLAHILGYGVIYGVNMLSLCHCWGWQPLQTASCIHIRHLQSVWANRYAVYGIHKQPYIDTHPIWLRFIGSGSLVESKCFHCVIVEADSHFKLLHASILDISFRCGALFNFSSIRNSDFLIFAFCVLILIPP